jgi:CubicO group peptidase (beta-lactamase class C family)
MSLFSLFLMTACGGDTTSSDTGSLGTLTDSGATETPEDSGTPGDSGTTGPTDNPDDALSWPAEDWEEATPAQVGLDPTALEALRAYAFTAEHNTQAVTVHKDGLLIAEWYVDGTDRDTPVTSWSAAKSVTSALIGVGIRDGLLTLDDPVASHLPEWADDDRAAITLRHMLLMQSGLAASNETYGGVYFHEPDQLAYSMDRQPVREPGERYSYVNEDSMVLGGVISAAYGIEAAQVAQDEIFGPLGLDATWWTDGAGNALTYCCLDSTARDLARFGLLYARGGSWNGKQLVPQDYVAESTSGLVYSGYYGLHWWVLGDGVFAAIGLYSQYIYVVPAHDLVVTRFGEYEQVGDETVREGSNYHDTPDEGPFDGGVFMALFMEALGK